MSDVLDELNAETVGKPLEIADRFFATRAPLPSGSGFSVGAAALGEFERLRIRSAFEVCDGHRQAMRTLNLGSGGGGAFKARPLAGPTLPVAAAVGIVIRAPNFDRRGGSFAVHAASLWLSG